MRVPSARQLRFPVAELLELDHAGHRSEAMPAAMTAMVAEEVENEHEREGSMCYWAARAGNTLLSGMGGSYLEAIERVFPSRKAQGRLYLLGGMMLARFVDDLQAEDAQVIVELWNGAPSMQLAFAAELGMRRELAEATNGTLQNVEACLEAARTYWDGAAA